jgi:hypothetical protein
VDGTGCLAECKEIAMSSAFAPNPTRFATEWSRPEVAGHSREEDAFARRVRAPWQSILPLVVGTLFTAALVATAVATPPSITVRNMLAAEGDASAIVTDYSLPAHWQPALPSPSAPDGPFACDPASSAFTC